MRDIPVLPYAFECPECECLFNRPAVTVTTSEVAWTYGPNAVQCPACGYVWNPGGPDAVVLDLT